MQPTGRKNLYFSEENVVVTKMCRRNRLVQEVEKMKNAFITFRSVTYAQRGERVLRKSGLGAQLQRTPKWMEEQGCGYCLRLAEGDLSAAVALLQASSVSFRRVYLNRAHGKLEEWKL